MRVLYVFHRYHTNMIETMQGWKAHGDDVAIIAQYSGGVEDHRGIPVTIMGYAPAFMVFYNFYTKVLRRRDPFAKDIRLKLGFPPKRAMTEAIRAFAPDLVILRERSLYTMRTERICRKLGIPTILYNLSPVYAEPSYFKKDWAHRFVRKHTPRYRITPVRQVGVDLTGKVKDEDAYFAPFVIRPVCAPEERTYLTDGVIRIFEIGKYQERKNHFMMVDVFERLLETHPNLRLTIAGECSDAFHEEYYAKLVRTIEKKGLCDRITLLRNIPRAQVDELYRQADIYVLASTGEPASNTVIEAMSNSTLAVSGTDNGTADYIEEGVTGAVYRDCDAQGLYEKLSEILADPEKIPAMGAAGYRAVKERFNFDTYYSVIRKVLGDKEKNA